MEPAEINAGEFDTPRNICLEGYVRTYATCTLQKFVQGGMIPSGDFESLPFLFKNCMRENPRDPCLKSPQGLKCLSVRRGIIPWEQLSNLNIFYDFDTEVEKKNRLRIRGPCEVNS
jgi:hypothetical protein